MKPGKTFGAADRIRKRSEYKRIYDRGRKIASQSFTLFILENDLGKARLGITVTRRAGMAVQRNRAKRLLREWFREVKAGLPGLDLIVNARAGVDRMMLSSLSRELDRRIRQALATPGTRS